MKVKIEEIDIAEDTICIQCANANDARIKEIYHYLQTMDQRLRVRDGTSWKLLLPSQILYGEYVNRALFLYTKDEVYPTPSTLQNLEQYQGFLRCSKTMVVNINKIANLRSDVSGSILATLQNKECIIISRHYASMLRNALFKHVQK